MTHLINSFFFFNFLCRLTLGHRSREHWPGFSNAVCYYWTEMLISKSDQWLEFCFYIDSPGYYVRSKKGYILSCCCCSNLFFILLFSCLALHLNFNLGLILEALRHYNDWKNLEISKWSMEEMQIYTPP